MALGHKSFGSRWSAISYDPAIDQEKSDLEKYKELLYDYNAALKDGAIVLNEGQKPTLFQIAPLESKQRRHAFSIDELIDKLYYVFRCGFWDAKGWIDEVDISANGESQKFSKPNRKDYGYLGTCATEEWVESCPFHTEEVLALGNMIWEISNPRPLSCRPLDLVSTPTEKSETESTDQK